MRERDVKNPSPRAKKILAAAAVVHFALLGAALADIRRRPADQIQGPKWMWSAVAFINFAGPVSYFLFGRKPAGASASTGSPAETGEEAAPAAAGAQV